jgi:hypothetical protein
MASDRPLKIAPSRSGFSMRSQMNQSSLDKETREEKARFDRSKCPLSGSRMGRRLSTAKVSNVIFVRFEILRLLNVLRWRITRRRVLSVLRRRFDRTCHVFKGRFDWGINEASCKHRAVDSKRRCYTGITLRASCRPDERLGRNCQAASRFPERDVDASGRPGIRQSAATVWRDLGAAFRAEWSLHRRNSILAVAQLRPARTRAGADSTATAICELQSANCDPAIQLHSSFLSRLRKSAFS